MPAILIVLLLGTAINVANTHPANIAAVKAELIKEVTHPVIEAADYSKLNK